MKAKVQVDDQLIEQAMATTGATSAEAAVEIALRELIQSQQPKDLLELAGRIDFRADFDHKAFRDLRSNVG